MAELHGLFQIRHPQTLVARSNATLDMLARVPDGRLVNGRIDLPRNPKFNALAHAVFHRIAKGTGHTIETVKMHLKAATGRVDLIALPDGRLALHGHPMDFGNMGEQEFRDFWDEALVFIFTEILPNCPRDVQREIEDMVLKHGQEGNR